MPRTMRAATKRALDDLLTLQAMFGIIAAEARIPVAIPVDVEVYLGQQSRSSRSEAARGGPSFAKGRGGTRIGAKVLAPMLSSPTRLADLVADIDQMTSFSSLFEHPQSGLLYVIQDVIIYIQHLGVDHPNWS
jgi:hypothetical protein